MTEKIYGKIMQGVGGLYSVRLTNTDTPATVACRARGSFRHNHISPLCGDDVILLPATEQDKNLQSKNKDSAAAEFVIDGICERKNALIRPPLANLDYLFITMSAASPEPVLLTTDKLICIAEYNKIEPVVVITKCELAPEYADELLRIYRLAGFTVFKLSAVDGIGVEPIKEFIDENMSGKISAFAGASGIGKSTLLNALFPHLSLSTSEISQKIQRGRHTTRKVELFALSDAADCGYITDTPGFSMLDFERFDFFEKDDLPLTMREFEQYIGECRYTKCSHTKEEGCAICQAVREGKIAKSRHESFCELYETLKNKKKWN